MEWNLHSLRLDPELQNAEVHIAVNYQNLSHWGELKSMERSKIGVHCCRHMLCVCNLQEITVHMELHENVHTTT